MFLPVSSEASLGLHRGSSDPQRDYLTCGWLVRARFLRMVCFEVLRGLGLSLKLGSCSLGLGSGLEVFGVVLRNLAGGSRHSEGFRGARRVLESVMWPSGRVKGSCVC